MEKLFSALDESVNFVIPVDDGGAFEARYVRRVPEYMIAYLSSTSGCNKACRFCHLTATGQTMNTHAAAGDFVRQAQEVMRHYQSVPPTERVNFNFMARGEPLANPSILKDWSTISRGLSAIANAVGIKSHRFNISTIMPEEMAGRELIDIFGRDRSVTLYYSLYSLQERFRRRWLPKSLDPRAALDMLADWQYETGAEVALHWAFIEGENDDEGTIQDILDLVEERGLKPKFNLVRYNPFSDRQGREPPEEILERNFKIIADRLGNPNSRIVPRVGRDVSASCGVFINPDELFG